MWWSKFRSRPSLQHKFFKKIYGEGGKSKAARPRVPIAERGLCPSGTVPAAGNASPERHHLAESVLLKSMPKGYGRSK